MTAYLTRLPLIGREKERAQAQAALQQVGNAWLLITGRGGAGKSHLLTWLLRWAQEQGWQTPANPLDLYHLQFHSQPGFARAIFTLYKRYGSFPATTKALNDYEQVLARGQGVAQAVTQVGRALLEDWNRMAQKGRMVLALDTLERLVPLVQPTAEYKGYPFWSWLQNEFLARLENTAVLLAGRPEARDLLHPPKDISFSIVNLQGFKVQAVETYIQQVLRQTNKSDLWPRLQTDVPVIYRLLAERTEDGSEWGVRPIYLALALDFWLRHSKWPFDLHADSAASIRAMEKAIIEALALEEPWADILPTLAWLRKGAYPTLWKVVRELASAEDAHQELEELRNANLIAVRVRPQDVRVFLHDEVYDMFQRHWLDKDRITRQALWEQLRVFYRERMRALRHEMRDMFVPEEQELTAESIRRLVAKRQEIHETLLEFVHYAFYLAEDMEEALQVYQRFREDALYSGDGVLFHLIQAEAMQSLRMQRAYGEVEAKQHEDGAVRTYWARRLKVIDRALAWLEAENLAHRSGEALFLRQASPSVPELAEEIRRELTARTLPKALTDALLALVDGWEALAQTYQGQLDHAEERLSHMKARLEDMPPVQQRGGYVWWLKNLAWGYYWAYSGYLARQRGHIYQAREAYKQALPHWRGLALPFHEAATRNDLSFATMLVGDESAAKSFCIDALNLRREAGVQNFLVLSLTTLAAIEWRAEHYDAALRYSDQAERIAQAIGFTRGQGGARINKAIALRLKYNAERMPNADVRVQYLRQAQKQIKSALQKLPPGSPSYWSARHVHLQILRDLARAEASPWDTVFQEIQDYIRAAEQKGQWLWVLTARVTEVWARVYAARSDTGSAPQELLRYLEDVLSWAQEHAVIRRHVFTARHAPQPTPASLPEIWNQMARFHTAWGYAWRYQLLPSKSREEALRQAGMHWTIVMEYNALIVQGQVLPYKGQRSTVELVYHSVKDMNPNEFLLLYQGCRDAQGRLLPPRYRKPEKLAFWRFLEDRFGPESEMKKWVK